MELLISDCFPPILSYLSLSDLLNLRQLSRRLKAEVDLYLPKICSLPLYLTTPRQPEVIAAYKYCIRSRYDYRLYKLPSYELYLRRLSFGTSGRKTFEDGTILQNQDHFRLADFVIINHSSKLENFLTFIKKHCLRIEKLALVIDHCEHYLPEVSEILEALPDIKVLLLESTFQDSCRYDGDGPINRQTRAVQRSLFLKNYRNNLIKLPAKVFESILELDKLEELYFFSKRNSQLKIRYHDVLGVKYQRFFMSMLRRLRVFHYNKFEGRPRSPEWFTLEFKDFQKHRVFKSLEELSFSDIFRIITNADRIIDARWRFFPALKKLIINKHVYTGYVLTSHFFDHFPGLNLTVLDVTQNDICISTIGMFSSLPALEQIHCCHLNLDTGKIEDGNFVSDYEIVPEELKNRTVKHLQVMEGPKTEGERNQRVYQYSKYFVKLETCTFLVPEYSVIRVADLRN